ncbi:Spore wall maturation protein DIT1 [Wickerhamomyces ciferrii]|uniref:Spore wall maturation protein DIT1 n=1 Tax=Wickerhamomyces ciferrii (strain ATCC 14091 / BCRC 22168 / CBS 111 / JCM 3599 / NBRC 0793 / NRRL Y-1031 F-60-10) TaxID=1206466 RepID=K0KND6_WICCF|nr:Spore wall maturation protein DIT1 [Wickerhamomyces ciferrii]CCH43697.1 Spore wall maturation protein DIT1 [Wickerhamomyces ciferrii]
MTVSENPETVDNSTFSKFYSIYSRDDSYNLLCYDNKAGFEIHAAWPQVVEKMKAMKEQNEADIKQYGFTQDELDSSSLPITHEGSVKVYEFKKFDETFTRGVILKDFTPSQTELATIGGHQSKFHDWFAKLIVQDSRVEDSVKPTIMDPAKQMANFVADFFAEHLKNTTNNDEWNNGGREYFVDKVHYFTSRGAKIECVLPAFPCKSSNTQKVVGVFPDKGEELALRRLIFTARAIEQVYSPGMKIFIVSDGHVFSDCIGVDDDVVDAYTERLKYFYKHVKLSENADKDYIGFVSLKDLFFKEDAEAFNEELIKDVQLPHYTGSKICEDAELSRRLLIAGCDTDAGKLREDVNTPDHPRLHLYRGFMRFMLEDLALHPVCKKMSKRNFKKTVSRVAFEMIKRNDAYSNLVELLFPFHLRLSIHAHTNAGPKYGIRLINTNECKIIKSLDSSDEPSFEDLLHIPTPWHNSIVKVEGHRYIYLTKSRVVLDAVNQGIYTSEWNKGDFEAGIGGHFYLKCAQKAKEE